MNRGDVNRAQAREPKASQLVIDAQIVRALGASVPSDQPSPETLGKIERRLMADLRAVRPAARAAYVSTAFGAIFVSTVSIVAWRLGAFAISVMTPVQAAIVLGALAISAALLTYSLTQQMAPGSRHRISPRLLPAEIVISWMAAIVVLFRFQLDRNFWTGAWVCLRAGVPIGVMAGALFWLVLRRRAILSPAMTGIAAGLLAGLAGTSVLEIHCPNLDAWHILVSHLGVAILCSMAGLALGLAVERRPGAPPKERA